MNSTMNPIQPKSAAANAVARPPQAAPWRVAGRAVIPEAPPSILNPGDYDAVLFDCVFSPVDKKAKVRFEHVLNQSGEILGVGHTREQACWLGARTRRAEMLKPDHYFPTLAGCTFGLESNQGVTTRLVKNAAGQVIGHGHDKHTATRQANLSVLRDKPLTELSHAEFSQMCLVVTVELLRTKVGRAKPGVALLRPDRYMNSGVAELRKAISQESELLGVPVNGRVHWCEERLGEVLSAPLVNGGVEHVELSGGQHVILRTQASQSPAQCIESVFETLEAQSNTQTPERERTH